MKIGVVKNEKEAQGYVQRRLLEVKEILDDIADQTGIVYTCVPGRIGSVIKDALVDNTPIHIFYNANERADKTEERRS